MSDLTIHIWLVCFRASASDANYKCSVFLKRYALNSTYSGFVFATQVRTGNVEINRNDKANVVCQKLHDVTTRLTHQIFPYHNITILTVIHVNRIGKFIFRETSSTNRAFVVCILYKTYSQLLKIYPDGYH